MSNINWNKVKIKHVLGIAKDLPGYPDEQDLLFHLIKETGDRKDPSFTDVQIAVQIGHDREKVRDLMHSLAEQGYLKTGKVTEEKMIVKVLKNPFI